MFIASISRSQTPLNKKMFLFDCLHQILSLFFQILLTIILKSKIKKAKLTYLTKKLKAEVLHDYR
jgi:hypothetical protein